MCDADQRDIEEIVVTGFTKEGGHNIFEISVCLANGSEQRLVRRYSDFASFHRALLLRCQDLDEFDEIPQLPSFQQLFSTVIDDTNYLVPDIDMLSDYCMMLLANLNIQFVHSFFDHANFDSDLRRKKLRRLPTQADSEHRNATGYPEYLVIADYQDRLFSIKAGDVVVVLGRDNDEWNLVHHTENAKVSFGWLPNSYLIWKEESDPLVEEIQTFLLDQRKYYDNFPQLSDILSEMDSNDQLKNGSYYDNYRVIVDSPLYCYDGQSLLLERGNLVIVVDKDCYGWWYVSCHKGEGWMASTVLDPRRASLAGCKTDFDSINVPDQRSSDYKRPVPFYVTQDYMAGQSDELCFSAGEQIQVLFQSNSGWWTVRSMDQSFVGLFPAVYLSRTKTRQIFPSGIGRAYNIGSNTTLAIQPPPRRISRDSLSPMSPLSPLSPPQLEGTIFADISPFSSKEASPANFPADNPNKPAKKLPEISLILARTDLSDRRVSLSAPNSPGAVPHRFLFSKESSPLSENGEQIKNPSRTQKPANQLLVAQRKISEGSQFQPQFRPHSPIPLRFYRKKSKMAANISDRARSEELEHSKESQFFGEVIQRLKESSTIERSKEDNRKPQVEGIIRDEENKKGSKVERGEIASEDEKGGSDDKERGSEDEKGGSDEKERGSGDEKGGSDDKEREGEDEKGGSDDEERGSEDEKGGSDERGSEDEEGRRDSYGEQPQTQRSEENVIMEEDESEESENEIIADLSRRRSTLIRGPRLGIVKFSPDVSFSESFEDQRKGASLKRLGAQNTFFKKQSLLTRTVEDLSDEESNDGNRSEEEEDEKPVRRFMPQNSLFVKQKSLGKFESFDDENDSYIDEQSSSSLETGRQPSPSLETDKQPSPSLETDRQPSPSFETDRQPSPSLETGRQLSPSLETGRQPSPSLETDRQPSPSLETGSVDDRLSPSPEPKMMATFSERSPSPSKAWDQCSDELVFTENHFSLNSGTCHSLTLNVQTLQNNSSLSLEDLQDVPLSEAIAPSPPPAPPLTDPVPTDEDNSSLSHEGQTTSDPFIFSTLTAHLPVGSSLTFLPFDKYQRPRNEYDSLKRYRSLSPVDDHAPDHTFTRHRSLSPLTHPTDHALLSLQSDHTSWDRSSGTHDNSERSSSALGHVSFPSRSPSPSNDQRRYRSLSPVDTLLSNQSSDRESRLTSSLPHMVGSQQAAASPSNISVGFLNFQKRASNKFLHEKQHQF